MSFPPNTIYQGNGYRWGTHDMGDASIASGINVQQPGYHPMGSRGYGGNFQDLSFPINNLDASSIREKYPEFWKTQNWKGSFGILHYLAKEGPNYNEGLHLRSFLENGSRNYTTSSWNIQDIKRSGATGNYIDAGSKGTAFRTPFHARYNITNKTQEYKYALNTDFNQNLPTYNGVKANPLSRNSSLGPVLGLIFSRFYHYHATLVEGPTGFINHNGVNGGGQDSDGFTYKVTEDEPIARKASGGVYNTLEKITTWSPYSGAWFLDFTNFNAYNKRLFKSSIWS